METFYLNCIYSWVNFAKPETSLIIYTHMFSVPLSIYPTHRLYFPFQPQTAFTHPLPYSRLFYLFLPFNTKHGHIKSTSTVSNCDLYFMPFCFQHDETSQRLNWPERDVQRLSSRKAAVASSVSQPFSWIQSVHSDQLHFDYITSLCLHFSNPMFRC